MNASLALFFYLSLGLALAGLRATQGARSLDALFAGLFWPIDLARHGIDLLVAGLLDMLPRGEHA